jgi:hypothetical protein
MKDDRGIYVGEWNRWNGATSEWRSNSVEWLCEREIRAPHHGAPLSAGGSPLSAGLVAPPSSETSRK